MTHKLVGMHLYYKGLFFIHMFFSHEYKVMAKFIVAS